jgi:hypothetical protein
MKRHTALSRTFSYVLPSSGTLTQQSLSKAHREPLRGVARGVLVAIGIALCIMPNAGSAIPMQPKEYIDYKTYAFYLLDWDKKQMKCLGKLYGKESAWNPAAKNGSHYGIPQGRSIYLSKVNGYKQIEWGLKYIHHRYDGDTCKAYAHWEKHNWH